MKYYSLLFLILIIPFVCASADSDISDRSAVKMLDKLDHKLDPTNLIKPCCTTMTISDDSRFLISDSLVKNLSCNSLTQENVFKSLQDDAFSVDKQWPIQNWSSGVLAQCWSLALSQRRLFYLARFNTHGKQDSLVSPDMARNKILDMIEKKDPVTIFTIGSSDMSYGSPVMSALRSGDGSRNFKSDIEARQQKRFYSPGNLGMVFGDRDRSLSQNKDTMKDIEADLSNGRLAVIILRPATTLQHSVLVKQIKKINENEFELTCYDSNQPGREVTMNYKNGEFYAPNIVGLFNTNPNTPVGVFLKDDDEMDDIQKVAFDYYKQLCSQIK